MLINGEINLRSVRRNYYTNSKTFPENLSLSETETGNSDVVIKIDEVTPAGIPPTEYNESAVSFIEPDESGGERRSGVIYENNPPETPNNVSETTVKTETTSQPASPYSYVRFFNLIPDSGNVNIFINSDKIAENVEAGKGTEYVSLPPGIYDIEFFSADGSDRLLYNYRFKALPEMSSTLALSGSGSIYSVSDISGSAPKCFFNTAYLRFAQLSMNAPAMDVFIDGIAVIAGITFGEVSAFIGVPSGVHNVKITASGTGIILINESENFPAGSVNNMLITSKNGDNYTLTIISDGNACL